MDLRVWILVFLAHIALLTPKCLGIRVGPCPTNKIAPYSRPEAKTLGFLLGLRPGASSNNPSSDCGPVSNPDDNPNLVTIDGTNQEVDYDPVNSEEDTENSYNDPKPPQDQRPTNNNNFGGFLNWWPGIVTPDNWPSRPPRPPPPPPPQRPPNWFWGWFNQQNRPPRPQRPPRPPPYADEVTKPVYEYIEDDYQSTTWKPGLVVGGPNSDIIGVTQDISNWSTTPTPRPTRPFIPGQRDPNHRNDRRGSQTIIGSFIDLLFK